MKLNGHRRRVRRVHTASECVKEVLVLTSASSTQSPTTTTTPVLVQSARVSGAKRSIDEVADPETIAKKPTLGMHAELCF